MAGRGRTKTTAGIDNTATRLFFCIRHVLLHIRGEFLGRAAPCQDNGGLCQDNGGTWGDLCRLLAPAKPDIRVVQ